MCVSFINVDAPKTFLFEIFPDFCIFDNIGIV